MNLLKKERFFVILIAIIFSILNSLHVIIQWINNPSSRYFTGIAHYFADYFLYTAQIAQGTGFNLLYTHAFTDERLPSTWYYWFNLLIGNIGNVLRVSPFTTYNVSLIILVFCLILLWYYVAKLIYPTNRTARITLFIFIITASSFIDYKSFLVTGYSSLLGQFWFSPTPAFNRLGGIPYHVFQTIVFTSFVILAARQLDHPRLTRLFGLSIVSILAAIANPQIILVDLALVLITIWTVRRQLNRQRKKIISVLVILLVTSLAALLTYNEFNRQVVFTIAKAWELTQKPPITIPLLIVSIGPLVGFIPFGIRSLINNKGSLVRLFTIYGTLSFLFALIPSSEILGVNRVRFLHPVPYVLLSLLATEGIIAISNQLSAIRLWRSHISPLTSALTLLTVYLILTIPSLYIQIINRINPTTNPMLLMGTDYNHVPKSTVEALRWLENQPDTPGTRVILNDPGFPVEVLIPSFTNKVSFVGHPLHTLYPDEKRLLQQRFFNGDMSPTEALAFLRNHRIGFVIVSKANPKSTLISTFPFLDQIYDDSAVVIFKVVQ